MATTKSPNYQVYVNDDDYYYAQQNPVSNELFPVIIIMLTIVSILAIIIFLIYTTCCNSNTTTNIRRHPALSLLNHYLFMNMPLTFMICMQILTSPLVRNSSFYLMKNSGFCTMLSFITWFVDAMQSIQLLLVWLMLLAERGRVKFCWVLYSDYELSRAMKSVSTDLEVGLNLFLLLLRN